MPGTSAFTVGMQLARVIGEKLDEFDRGLPDELFHYTDTNGLIGFLGKKGELWATDARCMNDTNELTLGNLLLQHAIDARTDHPAHPVLTALLAHPAYVWPLTFVTSFSTQRDLLSQWRAYAADGSGFALGFRSEALQRNLRINGRDPSPHLVRVEYDPVVQEQRASAVVESALDALLPLARAELDESDRQALSVVLGMVLSTCAASCKTSAFSEECEFRVLLRAHQDPLLPPGAAPGPTAPECQFRAGKYGLTPYISLRFQDGTLSDSLARVVIGPRNHPPDTAQKVRVLLANAGVQNWSKFPVDRAGASYR